MDQFLAEIMIIPFNFIPKNWAPCDGQIMAISQNTALFALLGTQYGGDGKSTFALPNLQGRVPIQAGHGNGLTDRFLGRTGGLQKVTLLESQIPFHTHPVDPVIPVATAAETDNPVDAYPAPSSSNLYSNTNNGIMGSAPSNFRGLPAGGGLEHNNMQPSLGLSFIIALQGIFPPRN